MARPPVKGKRLFKLASMTASVAGGYARSRVRKALGGDAEEEERSFRKASGERIAATLGELKGAAMKVGQIASAAKEFLPPEVADAMAKLQRSAPPMSFDVIEEQIHAELGESPEVLFQWFDTEPFAAASVGQVHRARTDDGREVVCKVQYPGVDGAVDSDLQQVKLALRFGGLVNVDKKLFDAMFEELRERLHEELDYCNEAENVRSFGAFHERHPKIHVPEVIGARSSKRVLTMSFEPGRSLSELGEAGADQRLRDEVGTLLATMLTDQLYEHGAVHGDPNPGNFAWREDGSIVVYDFGCVKRMEPDTIEQIRGLLIAARARDYKALDAAMHGFGAMRTDKSIDPEDYERWLHALAPPLFAEELYDYGAADLGARVKALVPWVVKRANWWQPVSETVILNRAVGGLYDNLRSMRARVPSRQIIERHLPA
jgi:predicted unusual protein kinase regulating ubiquinone biosynthesis (AarF/ABC1/UbiB family)